MEKVEGLDGEVSSASVTLQSKDGKHLDVDKKQAYISTVIKTSLENDASAKTLPVLGVNGDILKLIVEYMNHHNGTEPALIDKPLRSRHMKECVKDEWDATFIDGIESKQTLYDLILAANYMDIKALLHLGCAKVASMIKGQPLERIKEILDPSEKKDSKEQKANKST
mmetsp:Transcript_32959/g.64315  ORF Transcript_32959/g.64315 Transcript_32959/m.64315 type:complete len:168 (-) Transcript_32959:238-741(-)